MACSAFHHSSACAPGPARYPERRGSSHHPPFELRTRYALLLDIVLVSAAAIGAFVLRFDLGTMDRWHVDLVPYLATVLVIKPLSFAMFGLYRRYWRYTSLRDLALVGFAVAMSSAIMTAVVMVALLTGRVAWFSRAVLILDGVLTFCFVGGSRLATRLVAEATFERPHQGQAPPRRAIIAGAGDSGLVVMRELRRNPERGFVPVAFVDDDTSKVGKDIQGVPVVGTVRQLPGAIDHYRADEVIIAMPRAAGGVVREIADIAQAAGVRSRTVPGLFELLQDPVAVSGLREVDVADLVRRPQVASDPPTLGYLHGRVVIVTGAGGSIGRELCRQIAYSSPSAVVMLGHGENSIFEAHHDLVASFPSVTFVPVIADIRDNRRMQQVFGDFGAHVVFHAAAYKHVPLMEQHPDEAVSNNVLGTSNVVEAAARAGVARLVAISTDKAVSPRGVMGASKRVAEAIVRNAGIRHQRPYVVVRFGNVLGSRGSAFPVFRKQIAAGGPLTITHPEMRRYFMTIPEAVHLALQGGGNGRGGELYVLDMGEPIKILDLVQDLVRLSGLEAGSIPIVVTGIRPGEKLDEALWEEGARVESTVVDDVLKVTEPSDAYGFDVDIVVGQLSDAVARGDRARIEGILKRFIPTFRPLDVPFAKAGRTGTAPTRIVRRRVH